MGIRVDPCVTCATATCCAGPIRAAEIGGCARSQPHRKGAGEQDGARRPGAPAVERIADHADPAHCASAGTSFQSDRWLPSPKNWKSKMCGPSVGEDGW